MSPNNPTVLPEGSVFQDRYRIGRCINAGGMGAVYECVHLATQKRRALKVMLPQLVASAGLRARFELEARVTAAIESDHIVETFDAGIDPANGEPFLVMELLRGDDLESVIEARGPLRAEQAVLLLAQVALALDRTHAAGIVHRDLKPQNLFLTTRDDGTPRVKILDFGIAKVVADGSKTAAQTAAIGTPIYMSPEQTTGDGSIGPAADLYALAHIAYALLVGSPFWREEQSTLAMFAFLKQMIAGPSELPSARSARQGISLPSAFDAWFSKATARSPEERFDRASTQIAELAIALGTAPPRQLLGAPPMIAGRLSIPDHGAATPSGGVGSTSRPAVAANAPPLARTAEITESAILSSTETTGPARMAVFSGTIGSASKPEPGSLRRTLAIAAVVAAAIGLFVAGRFLGRTTNTPSPASASTLPAMTNAATPAPPAPPTSAAPTMGVPMAAASSAPVVAAAGSVRPIEATVTPAARPTGHSRPLTTNAPVATAAPVTTAIPIDPTRVR